MRNLALMWVLAALFVLNISSCNSKSANRLSDSGSAAVNDSILWFENTSSIELRFEINDLSMDISGTAEGAIAKYSNRHRIENLRQRYVAFVRYDEDSLEIRLDMEIWQNILERLFNTGIREWGKGSLGSPCPCFLATWTHISSWNLDIFINGADSMVVLVGD